MPKQVVHSTGVLTREPQTASVVAHLHLQDKKVIKYIINNLFEFIKDIFLIKSFNEHARN